MSSSSYKAGETNDCVVMSIALATNTAYEAVLQLCEQYGRKPGRGTNMRRVARPALAHLGFKVIEWRYRSRVVNAPTGNFSDLPNDLNTIIRSYPGRHGEVLKSITSHHPKRFQKQWSEFGAGRKFIAVTRSHALAIIDGEVHDWSVGRALRVNYMWEIVPI